MVDLDVLSQQLLLSRLVRKVSSNEVTVLFGLEYGDQVDSRPHLLAGELTVAGC